MAISRRELGAILLGAAAIVFYLVLLSTSSSSAQTGGGTTGGTTSSSVGCNNPEEIATFDGAENQITPSFEITGNTFRLTYDIKDLDNDAGFDSFSIRPIADNGIGVGDSVLVFDEGAGSQNILDGPGTFTLEIESDGFDYVVTVDDCAGTQQSTTQRRERSSRPERTVVNVPNRPLPPSGGMPVYGVVAGSVLAGTGLLALGLGIRRGPQR